MGCLCASIAGLAAPVGVPSAVAAPVSGRTSSQPAPGVSTGSSVAAVAGTGSDAAHPSWMTPRVIVRWRDGAQTSALAAVGGVLQAAAAPHTTPQRHDARTTTIDVPRGQSADDLAAQLRGLPGVASAEPDQAFYPAADTVPPTDPDYATKQWHLVANGTQNFPNLGTV